MTLYEKMDLSVRLLDIFTRPGVTLTHDDHGVLSANKAASLTYNTLLANFGIITHEDADNSIFPKKKSQS